MYKENIITYSVEGEFLVIKTLGPYEKASLVL